jgi:MFS family permease
MKQHPSNVASTPATPSTRWLNRTVFGIGLAALFSDWSREIATTVMPAFLATMGVAAFWVGLIEGVSDGLSSFAKMASGYCTDKLRRRKPVAVIGYLVTALGTASFGLATAAWHVLLARAFAWFGRGVRTPRSNPFHRPRATGLIGDREQLVEHDAEFAIQSPPCNPPPIPPAVRAVLRPSG